MTGMVSAQSVVVCVHTLRALRIIPEQVEGEK